jgi:AraC-like DNA-binding protein
MEDREKIAAVSRMQTYIVNHIDEVVTLEALSEAAGYSKWYAAKIFKELSKRTPFQYIRALRLTKAAKTLRDTNSRVVDVAMDSAFDSHDGFTRAFIRQFDITLYQYKRQKPMVPYFVPYPISSYYKLKRGNPAPMNNEPLSRTVTVTFVEHPTCKLILLRSKHASNYLNYCEEMGCEWEGLLNSIPEKLENAALITLPQKFVEPQTSSTAAGVKVPADYVKPIPSGYEVIDLDPCSLLFFQGMPFENEEDFGEAIDIVLEAIAYYQPERFGYVYIKDLSPSYSYGASAALGAAIALPVQKK